MKSWSSLAITLWMVCSSFSVAAIRPKGVYGIDNRIDVSIHPNEFYRNLARSTAAMISNDIIENASQEDGYLLLTGQSLGARLNLCQEERFSNQLSLAGCSGFLITPNLLVTAGHCMMDQSDCATKSWVFDYNQELGQDNLSVARVKKENVYRCENILSSRLDRSGVDYAVVMLDRSVVDRAPLKVRTSGQVAKGDEVVVIGHPSGLPGKIASGGVVRDSSRPAFFVTNLDTFGGNSGSAVINAETGLVEGILVRGDEDYTFDRRRRCQKTVVCSENSCKGEDVVRIGAIEY